MTSRLEQVADELYGLHPAEFTGTRDKRAKEATATGDHESAAAIRKLRRPSTSAWLTNMLRRSRPAELAELAELGEALRGAQATLAGAELRQLSERRRQLVDRVLPQARTLAAELGHPVSEGVLQELEGTLQAALVDAKVASAVAQGRLTTAQRAEPATGFGFGPAAPAPAVTPTEPATKPVDLQLIRARKELEKATRAVEAAEQAAATRRREAAEADQELARTTAHLEEVNESLRRATDDRTAAQRHAAAAHHACAAADETVEETRHRARRAKTELDAAETSTGDA